MANQTSQRGGSLAGFFVFMRLTQQGTQVQGLARACLDQALTQCGLPQTATGSIGGRTLTLTLSTEPGDPCPATSTTTATLNAAGTQANGTTTGNSACLGNFTVTYIADKIR